MNEPIWISPGLHKIFKTWSFLAICQQPTLGSVRDNLECTGEDVIECIVKGLKLYDDIDDNGQPNLTPCDAIKIELHGLIIQHGRNLSVQECTLDNRENHGNCQTTKS